MSDICDLCRKRKEAIYDAEMLGIKGLKPHVCICKECVEWCKLNLPSMKGLIE
jgi:hypothetical protein